MFNSREKTTSHALIVSPPAMTRAFAHRSPLLALAVALVALEVEFTVPTGGI